MPYRNVVEPTRVSRRSALAFMLGTASGALLGGCSSAIPVPTPAPPTQFGAQPTSPPQAQRRVDVAPLSGVAERDVTRAEGRLYINTAVTPVHAREHHRKQNPRSPVTATLS